MLETGYSCMRIIMHSKLYTRIPGVMWKVGPFFLVSYNFSESEAIEFLEALKTPTKKEAGSKNSEFSVIWTFLTSFGHFLDEKKLNIYENLFFKFI